MAKRETIIPDKYKHLIDTISPDGIEITESVLRTALNKLIGCRRRPMGKSATLEKIYETISDEDIFKNIKSASNLKSGNSENFIAPKKKSEDIRDIPITDDLEGYRPSEREFIQRRLCEYANDYKIEKSSDKTLAMQTILYEMWMKQLNLRVPQEPKNFDELIKQIKTLNEMISKNLSDLNALKKQVESPKNNKPVEENKDGGLAEILKKIEEQREILDKESNDEFNEEMRMLEEKRKRS